MSLTTSVNSILGKMHKQSPTDKGTYGEEAVLAICEDIYQRQGGILIHSYSYKTVDGLAGNIKRHGNNLYVENLGSFTEIDVLLCTPYRVFPIEVKAYKANSIYLSNSGITGCAMNNKSPEHQNEMHCRHLYPHIYQSVPDGMVEYIIPIVVFVDEAKVADQRTEDRKEYIKVTILNQFRQLIESLNIPYNSTLLDLGSIEVQLRKAMVSSEKFFPYAPRD